MSNVKVNRGALVDKWIKILIVLVLLLGVAFLTAYFYNRWALKENSLVSQSIKQLEEIVRKDPLNVNARFDLGRGYMADGRYDDAIQQFKEGLKIDDEHQGCLVYLGIAYMRKEDFEEAKKYFKREIRLYESAGFAAENKFLEEAYFQMATVYFKKNDYEKALFYVKKALLIGKSNSDNYFFLGRIYLEKGETAQAVVSFEKALLLDPKYADAQYGLAQALEKRADVGDLGRAVGAYHKAFVYADQQRFLKEKRDDLLEKIESLNEKNKKDFRYTFELAVAYLEMDQYDEAIPWFKKAIKLNPNFAPAYYHLGRAYEKRGSVNKGKQFYRKALSVDKEFDLAKAALKRVELGISEEEAQQRVW